MISPRSGNYDRLEGGLGPTRMTKKFAWKKFAIIAGVLVALVYFFGPRANRPLQLKIAPQQRPMDVPESPPDDPYDLPTDLPTPPPTETQPSTEPAIIHPTSFETDPDPSKTTYCTTPHTPNVPLIQYALMIDAGSTGSRIHIYKFNHCGPSASYEYETFKMTQPGLSKYAADPQGAARSLDGLLDEAVRVVPSVLRHCTPVAVKATAGLRLLPGSQSEDILHAVEGRLKGKYPFVLAADGKGVVIMDGKEEGVYAWITANYLLGTIGAGQHEEKEKGTYAVLDLGGGSTQIVFEPTFTKPGNHLEDGEHKYELKFGGKTHTLYQHSYLGYGLMRARKHVHSLVDFMSSIRATPPSEKERKGGVVGNPCLAKGMRRVVEVVDEQTGVAKNVTMDGDDIGSFEACDRILQLVLAKDAICELKPCSFNGVYQPSLLDSFPFGRVLLLSYFYDRVHPLIPPPKVSSAPGPSSYPTLTVSTIASLARIVCQGRFAWTSNHDYPHWATTPAILEELEGRPEYCLDLTFMYALLRMGYEFDDERQVRMEKKVGGTELGWCLGATIELVGGGKLTCNDGED